MSQLFSMVSFESMILVFESSPFASGLRELIVVIQMSLKKKLFFFNYSDKSHGNPRKVEQASVIWTNNCGGGDRNDCDNCHFPS